MPGKTDSFLSNEMIVAELRVARLDEAGAWSGHHDNASIFMMARSRARHSRFKTFGFPIKTAVAGYARPARANRQKAG